MGVTPDGMGLFVIVSGAVRRMDEDGSTSPSAKTCVSVRSSTTTIQLASADDAGP